MSFNVVLMALELTTGMSNTAASDASLDDASLTCAPIIEHGCCCNVVVVVVVVVVVFVVDVVND